MDQRASHRRNDVNVTDESSSAVSKGHKPSSRRRSLGAGLGTVLDQPRRSVAGALGSALPTRSGLLLNRFYSRSRFFFFFCFAAVDNLAGRQTVRSAMHFTTLRACAFTVVLTVLAVTVKVGEQPLTMIGRARLRSPDLNHGTRGSPP